MLCFIKSNEEIQRRINWRRFKSSKANENPITNIQENPEEIQDFPPTFNLKLEESNLGNICSHIDPNSLNPNFYTSLATKVTVLNYSIKIDFFYSPILKTLKMRVVHC